MRFIWKKKMLNKTLFFSRGYLWRQYGSFTSESYVSHVSIIWPHSLYQPSEKPWLGLSHGSPRPPYWGQSEPKQSEQAPGPPALSRAPLLLSDAQKQPWASPGNPRLLIKTKFKLTVLNKDVHEKHGAWTQTDTTLKEDFLQKLGAAYLRAPWKPRRDHFHPSERTETMRISHILVKSCMHVIC